MLCVKTLHSSQVCSLNIRELSEFAVDGVARIIIFIRVHRICALLALKKLRETIILRSTAMTSDFTKPGLITPLSYKIKVSVDESRSWQLASLRHASGSMNTLSKPVNNLWLD